MILATLAILVTLTAILVALAADAPRPQLLRVRQPTRAELLASRRRR